MTSEHLSSSSPDPLPAGPDWLSVVRAQVESLRYGLVQLVVHDGRVTQIDRTEKTRLPSSPEPRGRAF